MTRLAEGSYYFVYLTCFVKWYQGRYSMGNSARQLILDNQKNGAIPSFETLARMFHEWLTATTDMTVLPGVLGCRTLRRTVFRYASDPISRYRGTVARWHTHPRGLATAIHETSGLGGPFL